MPTTISPDSVRTSPLFSGMTEQDKDALLASGRLRPCPRGQMLFAHGEPVTHFYIIAIGTMQLFRVNPDGHEKTIDVQKLGCSLLALKPNGFVSPVKAY